MTQEEIIKGNSLIAKFMGYTSADELFYSEHKGMYFYNLKGGIIKITRTRFHVSYDWLMRVVEKIESLGVSSDFHYYAATKMYSTVFLGYQDKLSVYDHSNMKPTKIDSLYNACVEFIKWYNNKS